MNKNEKAFIGHEQTEGDNVCECDCKVRLERLERWADKVEEALDDLSGRTRSESEYDTGTAVPGLLDEE